MGVGTGVGPVVDQANVVWHVTEIGGCLQMTIWVVLAIFFIGWIIVSLIKKPRSH